MLLINYDKFYKPGGYKIDLDVIKNGCYIEIIPKTEREENIENSQELESDQEIVNLK